MGAVTMEPGSFLSVLAEADRVALESCWKVRSYGRQEMILVHDEPNRDVFFVLDGRVRATAYSEGGKAVAYRNIGPGDIFGEMAAIDGMPRSASVVALDPVRAASLSEAAFRQLVSSRPGLAWALLTHFSLQVRRLTERVYEFSTLVVRKRLVRELLRMASANAQAAGEASIAPVPTHVDLAARISTHREAVSREMSALRRKKLIERRGKALLLRDVKLLESICSAEE
jgi:CRP/FNR family transcriptional regulator, cyclic AMP receptor protein